MGVPTRHVLNQGPVLAALGRTAFSALQQQLQRTSSSGTPQIPGPLVERTLPPLPEDLLNDFVTFLGGDPRNYQGQVPAHLFPQWSFPLAARTLEGLPYPMLKVVNGGCRIERRGAIPVGKRLNVKAQLTKVDDDGRRALLTERVVTGTDDQPELLVAEIHAYVPLAKGSKSADSTPAAKKEKPTVPADAKELSRIKLRGDSGLSFAKLTGDFNPIHWIAPYAKASGFRHVILHGFGTFAFAAESLVANLLAGDPNRLVNMEARFTKPLVLPAEVGVFVCDSEIYVGTAPSGPAYMTGTFETQA